MSNDHVNPLMRESLEAWLRALRGKPVNGIERAKDTLKADEAMKIVDEMAKRAKDEAKKK